MGERVPFRWRTGTNPAGQHILICDRGGGPDSPQPNDTWTITLEPADFKYDHDALNTLAAMVDLWPAALNIIQRRSRGWVPDYVDHRWLHRWEKFESMSDFERRVLDLLAPEDTT